jgi:hypothetical protein
MIRDVNHMDVFGAKNGVKRLGERGVVVMDKKVGAYELNC